MTKKQMMALKPGDIVVEKTTGDEFEFVDLAVVRDIIPSGGKFDMVNPRKMLRTNLIPGFDYTKQYRGGLNYYFSHTRMAVKEAAK